jgi:hypothetical protein
MNILIIPHSPEYRFIHNRCHEIAQGLVDIGHNVYFLEWQTCKNRHIYTLIKSQIINLFLPSFCLDETKIKYIRIPILNLNRGSFFFSFINSMILNIFIKLYKIVTFPNKAFTFDKKHTLDVDWCLHAVSAQSP